MSRTVEITTSKKTAVKVSDIVKAAISDKLSDAEKEALINRNKARGISLKSTMKTVDLLGSCGAVKIPHKKGYHTNRRTTPEIVIEYVPGGISATGNDPKQMITRTLKWENGVPTFKEFCEFMSFYKHETNTSYSRNMYKDAKSGKVVTSMEKFYQVYLN